MVVLKVNSASFSPGAQAFGRFDADGDGRIDRPRPPGGV
jgi:hypothetical protein